MDELEKLLRNSRRGKRFLYPAMLLEECGYTLKHVGPLRGWYRFEKEGTDDSIVTQDGIVAFRTAAPSGNGVIMRNPTKEEVIAVAYFLNNEQEE